MDKQASRPLSEREQEVLAALLARPFTGRDELRRQIETARAIGACDCGCPSINLIVDSLLPTAHVKHQPIPVEAYVDEPSGRHHEILLHVHNGYAQQLELVTYDAQSVREWPNLADMRLFVYEEPTWSDGR